MPACLNELRRSKSSIVFAGARILEPGSGTYFIKPTIGKVPIHCDLIERGDKSEHSLDLCRVMIKARWSKNQWDFSFLTEIPLCQDSSAPTPRVRHRFRLVRQNTFWNSFMLRSKGSVSFSFPFQPSIGAVPAVSDRTEPRRTGPIKWWSACLS